MTRRFPLIAEALTGLRSRSCIIDGEAVACDDNGLASFERIRYRQHDGDVFLYAFDLIELNGDDLRRDPLQVRKATLASILAKARPGIRFNEDIEGDGPTVFAHACKMGLEGIVSKCKDFRPLAGLAQNEEPDRTSGEARRGGGLGEMTRRKREITGLALQRARGTNERKPRW
jgi:ATP-dependent DNA ligase